MSLSKKHIKTLQWTLALISIGYIISFFIKNSGELKRLLYVNPIGLTGLIVLLIAGHVIYSIRFRFVIAKNSDFRLPIFLWFKMIVLGRFLSFLAPQAGNIYRGTVLKKKYGISYTNYAKSLLVFTWIDTCTTLFVGSLIVFSLGPEIKIGSFNIVHILLLISALFFIFPIIFEVILRSFNFQNERIRWVHSKFKELFLGIREASKDISYIITLVISGIVSMAVSISAFYCCTYALNIEASMTDIVVFCVVLKLSNHINITPGNLGIREIVYGILSTQLPIGLTQGMMIAVALRIVGTMVLFIFGIAFGGVDLIKKGKYNE